MKQYLKLTIILFFTVNLYAKEWVYFFPHDADEAKNHIERLIKSSKQNIKIAMYNFSYKKFAKYLEKASKRGVKIEILFDAHKIDIDKESKYDFLNSKNNIKCYKSDKKLHVKIAIIDEKYIIFGSPNWTKKSFGENYEVLYITDKKKTVEKFVKFFKRIKGA